MSTFSVPRSIPVGETWLSEVAEPTTGAFAELKQIVARERLLDRQPIYYVSKVILTFGFFAFSIAWLFATDNIWLQIPNAILIGFVYVQIGFLGHDSDHYQIFRDPKKNAMMGLIVGNLLIGASRAWWTDDHRRHHVNPNDPEIDPNVDIGLLAYTAEQARNKTGLLRLIARHPTLMMFPVYSLEAFNIHQYSFRFLFEHRPRQMGLEVALLVVHWVWYLSLVVYCLGPWQAIPFVIVHKVANGLYLASVFAPNHKGMPLLESDSDIDYLRKQVLTARNITGSPITDFIYGGLNYQIEHHLFPTMPRNNLRRAQPIVKEYCLTHGVSYHETSIMQSYQEIFAHLNALTEPLRAPQRA
ncbi:MAG: fatty acid desaturase [Chloroflexi bacterium]|nr:fatty acid desaturase [Chloroflexota bacterium]